MRSMITPAAKRYGEGGYSTFDTRQVDRPPGPRSVQLKRCEDIV